MSRIENKTRRLEQIEVLLLCHPEGLTQSQIAQRLGVNRSTILRNLADLTAPIYEDHSRLFIDRESYTVNLHLNLHEALSIHLASRLMTTRMDRQNPHAASALRKLGIALKNLAPQISTFVQSSANTFDNATKVQDPRYIQVLEKLTVCWAQKNKVKLWYRSAESVCVKEYIFYPYFIEIGAVGQAIYTIGRVEPINEMRTFKIDRVERIECLNEFFQIPDEFDPEKLFNNAWGIWYTDQKPVEIRLKFSQRVAQRVRETRWHPTEQVTVGEDGSLLWQALIAEPKEMMPWIRGWGADVEVLEPISLREQIALEVKQMTLIYNNNNE